MAERKGAVRDTLGFIGVVLSLLFVGWEVRENTKVARGQTRVELTALNNDFLGQITGDSGFSELWRRAWIVRDELSDADEFRVELMTIQLLRTLENVHLQFQEGLIDEDALISYGFLGFNELYMSHPRFTQLWEFRSVSFDAEFVDYLEALR